MENKKLVLLDGDSLLYGAFCGIPGESAFEGVINLLVKALEEEEADHGAVVLTRPEGGYYKSFQGFVREGLLKQREGLTDQLNERNILVLSEGGSDSASILASLARACEKQDIKAVILTWDAALFQTVNQAVSVRLLEYTPEGLTAVSYTKEALEEKFSLDAAGFAGMTALAGDRLRGIPGVPGIGKHRAALLMKQFGSAKALYSAIEEVSSEQIKKVLSASREAVLSNEAAVFLKVDEGVFIDYEKMAVKLPVNEEYDFSDFMPMYVDSEPDPFSLADQSFHTVTDLTEAKTLFSSFPKGGKLGMELMVEEGEVSALSLCFDGTDSYCLVPEGELTPDFLVQKARALCERAGHVTCLDLKPQLGFLRLERDSPVMDAGVAAYLLDPLKDSYGYDSLAKDYLDTEVPSRKDLIGKFTIKRALKEDRDKAAAFVCYMSYVAFRTGQLLKAALKETGMERLYYDIELPLLFSLFHMEEAGIHVEKERLKEYGDRLKVQIAELEKRIYEGTGETFNINSPKQLGEVLFDHMKLSGGRKTKTGYSTAADVLEKLANDHPVVQLILDYRQLTKLSSTYADGLAGYIGKDGRIHGTFNQTITATGRISSTEPNLQNIPVRMELGREIRKVFVPKEGCVFIDADYSQIELRVLAHMSGDERLINAYKQAEDIHAITASEVFHIPLNQVTSLQRRNAKAVNFGIVYGISSFGLSEGLSITRKEASEYIEKYFETYPGVKLFLDRLVTDAREKGYAVSMFGRRRPVPELRSSNFNTRAFGERAAMNSPIQGTAADIIKIAMIRVDEALRKQGLKSKIVLQIHDELLIETVESEISQVKELLVNEMKHAADLSVSLEVEAKVGNSWFDAK